MPPKLLIDPESLQPEHVAFSLEEIQSVNPQRYEFSQLTRVCHIDREAELIVGVRDLTEDEFWVRGHMPGRPIFPGVLMLETAAQLCSLYTGATTQSGRVYGFGGADQVRFRRLVTVGDRFIIVGKAESVTSRRSRFQTQGIVDGKLAFEAVITGIALPSQE